MRASVLLNREIIKYEASQRFRLMFVEKSVSL